MKGLFHLAVGSIMGTSKECEGTQNPATGTLLIAIALLGLKDDEENGETWHRGGRGGCLIGTVVVEGCFFCQKSNSKWGPSGK